MKSPENKNPSENSEYIGPASFHQQPEVIAALRSESEKQEWIANLEFLYNNVLRLLKENNIEILKSSFRLKTQESIKQKKVSTQLSVPIVDIYGMRFVMQNQEMVDRAVEIIRNQYPTPEKFPWGLPTHRKGVFMTQYSHPDFDATRINIIFLTPDSNEPRIAEIQFFTPEQEKVEKETRKYYEKKRGKV